MPAASTTKLAVQVLDFEAICLLIQLDRLVCDFCSSGQRFACGFLQIPPRDGHPCRPANSSPCRVCRRLSLPSECALPGAQRKRGRFPIPTFSHREPPFCVAAEAYLFLAPFLAAFFAGALAAFFAPPFFAVAISLFLLSSKFVPRTQDSVAWLLLCTRLNDTQDIVVYIGFRFSCQLFFF